MARKKKGAEGAEGAEGGGKAKKGNLVPAIIIAVGLIVGGKMMGGGGSAATTTVVEATTTTEAPGPVVKLDPITLNMSDGRFLRVGLGFQLTAAAGAAGHGEAKPDTTDAAGEYAKALDIAIDVLGGRNYQELVATDGREAAKKELIEKLKHAYEGEIEDVYFTEFVLQ
jgi:flagellar FliL protein